ncbi:MAG: hypothetical protein FWD88_06625 [Treponema sp.]|nr:hypothetical protein [Treponema sp.]
MKMRKWFLAAVAVVAAIALAACPGTGTTPPDPGPGPGPGENVWEGGFSLAYHLADHIDETDHEVIFDGIPLVRAGGDAHVEFEVILHAGRPALRVTATPDWAGFDIVHRLRPTDAATNEHFNFRPGDTIEIAGFVEAPANGRLGLGYGETSVWMANWQSTVGEAFEHTFDLAQGNIDEMVAREGPNSVRIRLDQGQANGTFVITDLIIRGGPKCDDCGEYPCECSPAETVTVTAYGDATTVAAGSELQFSAVVGPDGARQAVIWSVNPAVTGATINATGLLSIAATAAPGPVTVRATAQGTTIYGELTVTIPSFGVSLYPASLGFLARQVGYTEAPPALTVTVGNTGNQPTGLLTIVSDNDDFELSDDEIANIAYEGEATFTVRPILGLAEGTHTATITVDGDNITAATITATFQVVDGDIVDPTGIDIDPYEDVEVEIGSYLEFTAELYPAGAAGSVTWSIVVPVTGVGLDPDGLTVTVNVANTVAPGTLTLRATATQDTAVYSEVEVEIVRPAPTGFTVPPATTVVRPGTAANVPFAAVQVPAYAAPDYTWSINPTPPTGVTFDAATGVLTVADTVSMAADVVLTITATATAAAGAGYGTATVTLSGPHTQPLGDFVSFTGYGVTAASWMALEIAEGGTFATVGPLVNDGVAATTATWVYHDGDLVLHQSGRSDRDHGIIMLNSEFGFQARDIVTVRARIYPAQGGWAAISQNIDTASGEWVERGQSHNANAGNIMTSEFTIGDGDVSFITGGTPPGIRIGPNSANNADVFIYSISVYRPEPLVGTMTTIFTMAADAAPAVPGSFDPGNGLESAGGAASWVSGPGGVVSLRMADRTDTWNGIVLRVGELDLRAEDTIVITGRANGTSVAQDGAGRVMMANGDPGGHAELVIANIPTGVVNDHGFTLTIVVPAVNVGPPSRNIRIQTNAWNLPAGTVAHGVPEFFIDSIVITGYR